MDRLTLRRALAVAGAVSLLAQVVLLREILASSQGNELVLGVALAAWLALGGLASALGGRWVPRRPARGLGFVLWLSPLLWALSLWLTRFARPDGFGQGTPMLSVLVGSVLALAPACFVGSLCFAWAVAARAQEEDGPSQLYVAETLGAAAAGLAFHFLLAERMQSAWVGFAAGVVAASVGASLTWRHRGIALAASVAMVLVAGAASMGLTESLARARFPGETVVALQPSRYGLLAVLERGGQRTFFHDGVLLFSTEDQTVAEELFHLPLLLHPRPRHILMMGGGLGGGLLEALKHNPERVDYVEMDPGILPLARAFADPLTQEALSDSRVHVTSGDGRAFLREARGRYDEILVELPVPQNALQARLASRECFEDARRALAPGGVLVVLTPGAETYLDPATRDRHASLLATLQRVFPEVAVAPGWQTIVWASAEIIDARVPLLASRLRERGVQTLGIGSAWLSDRLSPLRGKEYRRALSDVAAVENRDLRPVVYLFGLIENLRRSSPGLGQKAHALARVARAPWLMVGIVLLVAGLALALRRRGASPGFAVAATGAAGMCLELVLLIALQAFSGSLYHLLGGVLAAFMAGMAMGASMGGRPGRGLARACFGAAGIALLACVALLLVRLAPSSATLVFVVLAVLVGGSVGAVFSRAAAARPEARGVAGVYAWDLVGSAVAALLTSLVGIPLLGLVPLALLAATLCAAAGLANLGRA